MIYIDKKMHFNITIIDHFFKHTELDLILLFVVLKCKLLVDDVLFNCNFCCCYHILKNYYGVLFSLFPLFS
jgi:hypothetical protein